MISAILGTISESAEQNKLRTLYEQYRQTMYRAAYAILREPYLAEDAVHNAFLKAASHLHQIGEAGEQRTCGYLCILARNAAIDIYNSRRRQLPTEEFDETLADLQDVELETESRAVLREVYDMICSLEPSYCDILLLKFYYDLDDAEIADTLGITISNARVRLHRAREKLKQKIREGMHHAGS